MVEGVREGRVAPVDARNGEPVLFAKCQKKQLAGSTLSDTLGLRCHVLWEAGIQASIGSVGRTRPL